MRPTLFWLSFFCTQLFSPPPPTEPRCPHLYTSIWVFLLSVQAAYECCWGGGGGGGEGGANIDDSKKLAPLSIYSITKSFTRPFLDWTALRHANEVPVGKWCIERKLKNGQGGQDLCNHQLNNMKNSKHLFVVINGMASLMMLIIFVWDHVATCTFHTKRLI